MNTTTTRKPAEDDSKSAKTRMRILTAAEVLFIQHGFDGTSIRDITRKTRVNEGLVYYYFKNKQALFDAVLERYFDAQREALMEAMRSQGALDRQVHAAIDAYLDFVERNPGFPRLVLREVGTNAKSTRKIAAAMSPMNRWGTAVFEKILPTEGPLAARHFFVNFFAMAMTYYLYAPLLEGLWGFDPMSPAALAERRQHIHIMLDAVIEKFLAAAAQAAATSNKGEKHGSKSV